MSKFKIEARMVRTGKAPSNFQVEAFDSSEPPTWRSEKVLAHAQLDGLIDDVNQGKKLVLLVQKQVALPFSKGQEIKEMRLLISEWNSDRSAAGGALKNPGFLGLKVKDKVPLEIKVPLPDPKSVHPRFVDTTLDTTLEVVTLTL